MSVVFFNNGKEPEPAFWNKENGNASKTKK
jgi:hypothetical protein